MRNCSEQSNNILTLVANEESLCIMKEGKSRGGSQEPTRTQKGVVSNISTSRGPAGLNRHNSAQHIGVQRSGSA